MTIDEAIKNITTYVYMECENIPSEVIKALDMAKDTLLEMNCKYDCNSIEEVAHNAYNRAIDDLVKFASDMPTKESEDGEIRPMWLEEMAEQLKEKNNGKID